VDRLPNQLQKLFILLSIIPWLSGIPSWATELKPETVAAFNRYVNATESRMDQENHDGQFLVVDRLPETQRREAYDRLQHGQIVIQELHTQEDHLPIRIPSGLIHHWAGVMFIPMVTLAGVNAVLQDHQNEPSIYKPEIRQAKLIERNGSESKIFLQMYSKSLITVVFNGYFNVTEKFIGSTRIESASHSTRIAEVVNPGGADEHESSEQDSHGYLWRLNSYWRLEEKDGGVYVQNESITLTRTVPPLLAWLIGPLTKSIPHDVLEHMLMDTQKAVSKPGAASNQVPLADKRP
jgi:hypothetical protein